MKEKVNYLIKNFEKMSNDELYEFIVLKLSEEDIEELFNKLYKMKRYEWLDKIYEILTSMP